MGSKSTKSRSKAEILAGETRCIYCGAPPVSVEHMPPRSMFKASARPSGLEFASCVDCNNGTSAADLVAGFIARISPRHGQEEWKIVEARARRSALDKKAPGFLDEFFDPRRAQDTWMRSPSGIRTRLIVMKAGGPMLDAYLDVFAAKLGMALYREHCGAPIPLNGGVFCAKFLNAGLAQETADALLSIMPVRAGLQQGRANTAHDQFFYRFNTDDRSVVAAFARFHDGLYVCTLAFSDLAVYGKLRLPPRMFRLVRPGQIPSMMPIQSRTWAAQQRLMQLASRHTAGSR